MSGLAVLSLGLVSQCLGLGLLTFCLSRFTSAVVSVSLLAVPAITAVLAWILFAETLTLVNGLTFVVVLMGIYLAISAPKSVDEQSININLVNEG
jgi:drug/metabolite transporter (DMT)-like permease